MKRRKQSDVRTRTKLALSFAVFCGLVGAGVVHTTSFPHAGTPGVAPEATDERELLAETLREHLRYQTIGIGQRQAVRDGASWALVDYLTEHIADAGFEAEYQEYKADGRPHHNVIAEKPGRGKGIVLVGCHYDGYGRSPSAVATGSGTAALIEVMKRCYGVTTDHTLRFVFFSTGEAPYRGTDQMGARHYAKQCKEQEDPLEHVLLLDSFGSFSSQPATQQFLFPWSLVFPKTADFAVVAGRIGDRKQVRDVLAAWARATDMPARGLAMTSWIARIRGGDQEAFHAEGYPAVLITDTGVNRFEDIRSRYDTFDRIDYIAYARAVEGLAAAVLELAGR